MAVNYPKFRSKRKRFTPGANAPKRLFSGRLNWKIFWGMFLLVSALSNFFLVKRLNVSKGLIVQQEIRVITGGVEPATASSEISGKWYGLCGKNTVHSVKDFHEIVMRDPLLTWHFTGFNWEKAEMGQLSRAIWTHVTYRKNGHLGVTRKVLKLPKGDGFITDGDRWVRTYCCNDYVLAAAPGQEIITGPARLMPLKLYSMKDPAMNLEMFDTDLNRLLERIASSMRENAAKYAEAMAVPEPNSLLLVAIGVVGLFLAGARRFFSR